MLNREINKEHACCFIGHRKIEKTQDLKKALLILAERLITENGVDTFLFGSKSEFNDFCRETVTQLRGKYPNIKRIYVRGEFPYINDDYKEHLLQYYEDTYYPESIVGAGKAVYVERNYEMIDKSHFCIFYLNENYKPSRRKNSRKDLFDYQPKSGTKIAYDYAIKNNRKVFNLFCED